MKRCYKCGRIAPASKSMERRLKAQTGGDGWREAEPEVGQAVTCSVCGLRKEPIGRSAPGPMAGSLCDHECSGYSLEPAIGSLWPGESRAEFGYPKGRDMLVGTDPAVLCPECKEE